MTVGKEIQNEKKDEKKVSPTELLKTRVKKTALKKGEQIFEYLTIFIKQLC